MAISPKCCSTLKLVYIRCKVQINRRWHTYHCRDRIWTHFWQHNVLHFHLHGGFESLLIWFRFLRTGRFHYHRTGQGISSWCPELCRLSSDHWMWISAQFCFPGAGSSPLSYQINIIALLIYQIEYSNERNSRKINNEKLWWERFKIWVIFFKDKGQSLIKGRLNLMSSFHPLVNLEPSSSIHVNRIWWFF